MRPPAGGGDARGSGPRSPWARRCTGHPPPRRPPRRRRAPCRCTGSTRSGAPPRAVRRPPGPRLPRLRSSLPPLPRPRPGRGRWRDNRDPTRRRRAARRRSTSLRAAEADYRAGGGTGPTVGSFGTRRSRWPRARRPPASPSPRTPVVPIRRGSAARRRPRGEARSRRSVARRLGKGRPWPSTTSLRRAPDRRTGTGTSPCRGGRGEPWGATNSWRVRNTGTARPGSCRPGANVA